MDVITTVNGLKLEHSNTVIVYENQPVVLSLNKNYKLTFSFIDDDKSEQNMEFDPVEKGLNITLKNFNNILGTTTARPIEFASINQKPLYISFCLRAINDVKILQYNIYIKE